MVRHKLQKRRWAQGSHQRYNGAALNGKLTVQLQLVKYLQVESTIRESASIMWVVKLVAVDVLSLMESRRWLRWLIRWPSGPFQLALWQSDGWKTCRVSSLWEDEWEVEQWTACRHFFPQRDHSHWKKKHCTVKSVETWHNISWEMFWALRVLKPSKALSVFCRLHTHFTTKSAVRVFHSQGRGWD